MLGFLKEEGEKLGSAGRFKKRIQKFHNRNDFETTMYNHNIKIRDKILQNRASGAGPWSNVKGWDDRHLKEVAKATKPMHFLHPAIEHHFWWLTHNWLAHFLIGLAPIKISFDFHDWTSKKLNAD